MFFFWLEPRNKTLRKIILQFTISKSKLLNTRYILQYELIRALNLEIWTENMKGLINKVLIIKNKLYIINLVCVNI